MTKQWRKMIGATTITYTLLILYFMLLGFGRTGTVHLERDFTFILLPVDFFRLPSVSDLLHPALMDLVGFGNIAAFVPFGLLIPLLYRLRFVRFMTLFILSILVIETIQALTLLGSFDMNDVIQNALGAAVGFGSYKLGCRTTDIRRKIAVTSLSIVVLMIGIWGSFGIVSKVFTEELGPFVSLNEWKDSTGKPSTGAKPYSFEIGGQKIEPQYNVYSAEGKKVETYTYMLGNKELYLYLNYGIPDQEDFQGSITASVDGEEFLSTSAENQRPEWDMTSIYLERAKELTITIEGNERLWDVGFREMKYSWEW
ncbi:VanZ family protein [Paenibacillus curdlanolyticus YK9]|uniref:VanZ family protein n=1 Tax=Paenibacillus curdlanolyticus YK9 TaxID=717606 RepID=E0I9I4_9BACL|nr:VanZ family protein [Paenibacillus curdlanolyticus]EFM11068.1 VanZ family protein [Paenibacillus curdlanolyticus YK9]